MDKNFKVLMLLSQDIKNKKFKILSTFLPHPLSDTLRVVTPDLLQEAVQSPPSQF
jgi:hypothetical protein